MQRKTILLFLSLMFILTGCTNSENKPVDSSTAKPIQKETPKKEQPTQGSIHIDNPQTTSEDDSNENEATNDPKEDLTKILTKLQELDELLNGSN